MLIHCVSNGVHFIQRLSVAAGCAALMTGAVGAAPRISAEEHARLDHGEVLVTFANVTTGRAIAVVEAPPSVVWKHIDNCAYYDEFLPRVSEAEELSRKGTEVTCKVVLGLPFPLPSLWSVTVARHLVEEGNRYRREWRTIDGSYQIDQGSWVLSPWNGSDSRTLLDYSFKVVPKASLLVPAPIRSIVQRRTLPQVIEAIRDRSRNP